MVAPIDALLVRARALWEELAAAPVSFPPSGGVSVVVSPESRICPPGWTGIVRLGDAAIVTAPDDGAARTIARAVAGRSVYELVDPEMLGSLVSGAPGRRSRDVWPVRWASGSSASSSA